MTDLQINATSNSIEKISHLGIDGVALFAILVVALMIIFLMYIARFFINAQSETFKSLRLAHTSNLAEIRILRKEVDDLKIGNIECSEKVLELTQEILSLTQENIILKEKLGELK